MAENTKVKKPNKIATFFRDLKSEFKRISWPTLKQTTKNTGIVIAFIVILGLFVVLVDLGFGKLFELILNK